MYESGSKVAKQSITEMIDDRLRESKNGKL